jgi:hypothetical protein
MVAGVPSQVTEATPDRASVAEPVTLVEAPVKVAPEAGEVMDTVGRLSSRLMTRLAVAVFPALSTAVPITG